MIICVYHGSTFKTVNETQTRKLTERVRKQFNQRVVECYYSQHVLATMTRRGAPLPSFEQTLSGCYEQSDRIYILVTNMMNGVEYQNIMHTIEQIDVDKKVETTPYLLAKSNIYKLASCISEDQPTIFVGHGNGACNDDYRRLNDILSENNNYVITLNDNIEQFVSKYVDSEQILVRPLLITRAYHAKRDIEGSVKKQLTALGYEPLIKSAPLATDDKFQDLCLDNLKTLIKN